MEESNTKSSKSRIKHFFKVIGLSFKFMIKLAWWLAKLLVEFGMIEAYIILKNKYKFFFGLE